jgi:hypothetical protein
MRAFLGEKSPRHKWKNGCRRAERDGCFFKISSSRGYFAVFGLKACTLPVACYVSCQIHAEDGRETGARPTCQQS